MNYIYELYFRIIFLNYFFVLPLQVHHISEMIIIISIGRRASTNTHTQALPRSHTSTRARSRANMRAHTRARAARALRAYTHDNTHACALRSHTREDT